MDGLHAFDLDVGNHLTDETIMQAIVWRIFQNLFLESHWRTHGLTFRGSGTFNRVEIPDTKRVLAETQSIQTIQSKNFTIHAFS